LRLYFMIYFDFLFIRLSRPHDSGIMFSRVNPGWLCTFFMLFIIIIFANFIFQHLVRQRRLKLNFVICFDLLSLELSQTYDQSGEFGRLNLVKSSYFFIFFPIRLSRSDNPGYKFGKSIDSGYFYVLFF
jgi:hypothetical protein